MNWSSWESASLPQANFKIGGFRNSEAGRLNCYNKFEYRNRGSYHDKQYDRFRTL
ncbi:hypothetical protein GN277_10200 [Lachnospiraceae bacterium WCA-9-b2]|uniref:Uncharacterized protein n=1 Tax=Sporofaciens musculi TaxID=2681861 RepID=A0A7X3MGA9_9FIRM|nr:hypothetical protein [Sporofaciens musculi]MXP75740.1 hypothetical protein [Sporofaciens musculi]